MAVSGRTSPPVTGCLTDQELLVSQDVQHSVLESHAKEAAVTERHVRQSVALQVKYEQENRIALAAKEYKAALDALEARNAERVHQITTAAAKRERQLEEALRAALAERDEARAAAAVEDKPAPPSSPSTQHSPAPVNYAAGPGAEMVEGPNGAEFEVFDIPAEFLGEGQPVPEPSEAAAVPNSGLTSTPADRRRRRAEENVLLALLASPKGSRICLGPKVPVA